MTPEGRIKLAIRKVLDGMDCYYFMPVQMGLGARTLDFLVCYQGMFFGIEAKATPQDEPTDLQKLCMRKIRAAGGEAIVIRSVADCFHLRTWLEGRTR